MTEILAVTCATGKKHHAEMTNAMIDSLLACDRAESVKIVVVAQALDGKVHRGHNIEVVKSDVNCGFGLGMNKAIECGLRKWVGTEKVLVLNNDLTFPETNWLAKLLRSPYWPVKSPTMDNTGTAMLKGGAPGKGEDYYPFVGATCWMIDRNVLDRLREKHGFWLFDPEFGLGYGEDDYTAVLIQRLLGNAKPFQVVRSSWVHHERAQTSKDMAISRAKQSALLRRKLARLR